jgi:hypothetical protein
MSDILDQIKAFWATLDKDGREALLSWVENHCATCGREARWTMADGSNQPGGSWCDACCEEGMAASAASEPFENIDPDEEDIAW